MEIKNKIYCTDVYEAIKSVPDNSVDCIYTDVPYLYDQGGGGSSDVAKRIKENAIRLAEAKIDKGFNYNVFNDFARVMKKINMFIWCSKLQIPDILNWWINYGKQNNIKINYEFLFWGKCLGGTTKVWIKNQNEEVSKLMIKDLARLRLDASPIRLFNGQKWCYIRNVVRVTHNDVYKITLRNGNEFYASSEHQFPINKKLIKVKDLKVKDVIDNIQLELGSNFKDVSYISKEVPWFIGYFIANGSYTRNKIQIATNQDKNFVVDKIDKLCKQYGAYHYIWNKKNSKIRLINISSPALKGFLEEYITGKLAYGKHCSQKVWGMPKWFLQELLQGYLDGDGTKENENNYRLGFTRKNYDLQNDFLTICNILGYSIKMQKAYATLNNKKYPTWKGRIALDKTKCILSDYEIIDIKKIKNKMDLYDIQIESKNHLFALADGMLTHNCNPTPATNNVWLPDTEYCLYFRETGVRLNDGYDHKHKFYVSGLNVQDKNDYEHPSIKPLDIVIKHLEHTTQPNDLIFDPFLGSGTTAIAAKRLGRNYLGFEINERFYNIAKDRLSGINARGEINLFDVEY